MRPLAFAIVGLGVLVAGCVNAPTPSLEAAPELPEGFSLDCSIASSWAEPCLALASPNDSPAKVEIDLAVNPTDPNNVVVGSKDLDPKASPCVWAVAQVTKDGGKTWKTSYIGGETSQRMPGDPLWGWQCITDPIMVFDAKGTLFYSLQAYDHTVEVGDPTYEPLQGTPLSPAGGSEILMARSMDGGETWDRIIPLHVGDGTTVFHDYMRMAVSPKTQTVFTIWNQFTGPAAVLPVIVASRDGGESADEPVYLPLPPGAEGKVVMSGLAIANDGTVYVALNAGGRGLLTVSKDDGRTWSTPADFATMTEIPRQKGNNSFRTGSEFELAVDTSGGAREGWLYSNYATYENEDPNVYAIASSDGGATWSEPVLVSHGERKRGDQWMARPWVDGNGAYHIVYLDRSRDSANYGIDATWAVSVDGASSFANTVLTKVPSDGNKGIHQDGYPFYGDYLGIGSAGEALYMGFPTTVTGRAEIAVAKVRLP